MFALSHFSQPLRSSPEWITLKAALPTAITNCIFSQVGQVPHSAQPEVRAERDRHKWGRWSMAWTSHWQCQFQWTEVTVWQCPKCLQLLSTKPSVMDRQLPAVASKEFWEKMWQSAWPFENTPQLSCQFASQHVPLSCCPPPPIPTHTSGTHPVLSGWRCSCPWSWGMVWVHLEASQFRCTFRDSPFLVLQGAMYLHLWITAESFSLAGYWNHHFLTKHVQRRQAAFCFVAS